jgi:hypothetical protein
MRNLKLFTLVGLMTLGSCTAHHQVEPLSVDEYEIWVFDETEGLVGHARAYLVNGLITGAVPSSDGIIKIQLPSETREGALLICAEGYHCGGWLLEDLTSMENTHGPLTITLAALRLR